ncbi:c-type cytochrome [Dyadobacter sp. Leaf189]|uniref:c-type cytochrome n=1 Tax=Dyadobacter sp. Leaf189 TaxID=1736295 RepID=UPI0006F2BA4A|nr:c-type cytochrome [Dyadobacter sp. Leaf189]KQS27939.1 cytochrome c class I [Dyadobacter sp. Leaf189]
MKFRTYLETIAGIGIYPMISLVIFFVFFLALLIFVFRIDKKSLSKMESIPLQDGVVRKGILSALFFFLIQTTASAAAPVDDIRAISGMEILLIVLLGVLVFIAVLVVVTLGNAISLLQKVNRIKNPEAAAKADATSWWKKFAGMGVSIGDEKHILIDGHDYDGIQELDNRMPPWLQSLFLGTIVVGVAYAAFYFGGLGDKQLTELDKEIAQAEVEKKAYMEKVGASLDENTVTQLTEAPVVEQGKAIFQEKCTACHGVDGGGSVGPNLTDAYWLHGSGIKNLFKVIKYGVPEKGMISWEKQLSPTDIQKVASYVLTLKGTKPANPKEPQGEMISDEQVATN